MNQLSPILKNTADEQYLRSLILEKAQSIGPSVTTIVENIWLRAAMTALYDIERFLKLAEIHSSTRLEAASRRALFHGHGDYHTVDHILVKHLDRLPLSHYADINGQLLFWPEHDGGAK
jgi:hypothetical protein